MVMFNGDDSFVLSPSDLTATASCEFGWLRNIDAKLVRIAAVERKTDAMMERTAVLGDVHEVRVLDALRAQHGAGVIELARPQPYDPTTLTAFHEQTIAHLKEGVDVLFQGVLFDGGFGGMADFIVRQPDGTYQVQDAKLARSAKVTALLQIAAYADLLDRNDVPRSRLGALILGDQTVSEHDLDDVIPVYRHRRAQLEQLLSDHLAQPEAVAWNSPDVSICGSCEWCVDELERHRDLLLVAGLARPQRVKLRAAGIETIEQLADSTRPVAGMSNATLAKLRLQARLQVDSEASGGEPAVELLDDGRAIGLLPAPSDGDIFFDFEGDPLWTTDGVEWGLEYLWGVIEPDTPDGTFVQWWAHDRAEEKDALIEFLDYVVDRRGEHPGMHVYHYAPYEITALKKLVARHATHEDVLDDLLRANVFVDLYATVRRGIRVGTRSYSIKKLEPLYMGEKLRTGLDNAADSIAEYQRYCDHVLSDLDAAQLTLDGIADYNRYDCVSTWRLRDWLLLKVARGPTEDTDQGADRAADLPKVERIDELAPLVEDLLDGIADMPRADRTDGQQAIAMLAASLAYHRREQKSFWWSYYERLVADVSEWPEPRDCFVVDRVELVDDWHRREGNKLEKRRLRLSGRLDPATRLKAGSRHVLIYDEFPPGLLPPDPRGRCVGGGTTIESIELSDDGEHALTVLEAGRKVQDQLVTGWDELPMGLCVVDALPFASIDAALQGLAREVQHVAPELPTRPALDLLRRIPPRLAGERLAAVTDEVTVEQAILDSLHRLDRSYLAVQGPPGTGKTHVGSRVVKQLVESGWKVGVVAQSHDVIENFLMAAIKAGLDTSLIAKQKGTKDAPWLSPADAKLAAFLSEPGGRLMGGTVWDMTSRKKVQEEQLDLLVIDEAGQFSLANTLASASSARRILLLGDPQQLPQVSKGTHPEPVDESALSWVANGHATVPATHGYFLERTWRMHSALTEVDSHLSYEGRLLSETSATDSRELSGVEPGVHPVPVAHEGRDSQSAEEAAKVVEIVRSLAGATWRESPDGPTRALTPADVLVVAPYNAQVTLISETLTAAGLAETRVGTVDKFQGKEAPVVIVSMTASSAADVPRGLEFLLNRNRLNVAISRGQWASYIVHSPALGDALPRTPTGLVELGAFLRVLSSRGCSGTEGHVVTESSVS